MSDRLPKPTPRTCADSTPACKGPSPFSVWAGAGRVDGKGVPNLLQVAVIIRDTMPATYLAGVPILLQRVVFSGLAAVGRALGYRTGYPEFGLLTDWGVELPGKAH